jgi:hypothetical protein
MRAQHNPHGLNVGSYHTTRPAKAVFIAQRPTMRARTSLLNKVLFIMVCIIASGVGYVMVSLIAR